MKLDLQLSYLCILCTAFVSVCSVLLVNRVTYRRCFCKVGLCYPELRLCCTWPDKINPRMSLFFFLVAFSSRAEQGWGNRRVPIGL